jgi:hypothetical protein
LIHRSGLAEPCTNVPLLNPQTARHSHLPPVGQTRHAKSTTAGSPRSQLGAKISNREKCGLVALTVAVAVASGVNRRCKRRGRRAVLSGTVL